MTKRTLVLLVSLGVGTALLFVVFIALRLFFFAPYKQPSSSMYPSFTVDTIFFVNRTDKRPDFGKVMLFELPENPAQVFDKRVVGLEGDVVETRGETLVINGWEVPRCRVGKHTYDDAETLPPHHEGNLDVEWLGDETYLVFHDDGVFLLDFGPYKVKTREYFVVGDNRANSHDSRAWFAGAGGGVPYANTVGHARSLTIALPLGAETLRSALDACLAKKPAKTRPPSHA